MSRLKNISSPENTNDPAHGVALFWVCALAACLTCSGAALAQPGSQLTAYDFDGNELGLIGDPDNYSGMAYSPDGSRIAATTSDFRVRSSSLRIIDVETGETIIIKEAEPGDTVRQPVWSPDGRELAFLIDDDNGSAIYHSVVDGDGDAQLIYFREGEEISLGDWSLHGLVFASSDRFALESRLYLLDPEPGSDPRVLAEFAHRALNPRMSPDGRYISYFDSEGALFVTRTVPQPNGAQETWQLTSAASTNLFLPEFALGFWDVDEPVFYRIEVNQSVRVLATPVDTAGDFAAGEAHEVARLPISVVTRTATLSRDGEQLLIAAEPPRRMSIVVPDGTEVDSVGVPVRFRERAFSPDFSRVAATTSEPLTENAIWELYVLDSESGEASLIGLSDPGGRIATPVWSPDGHEVAFVALQGSRYNVYRRPVDAEVSGNGELVYSHAGGPIELGDWSLDGRYLVFVSGRTDPVSRLHVIGLASAAEPIVVAEDAEQPMHSPRFSPDGRYLSYLRGTDETELYVTRAAPAPDGSRETWRLTTTGTSSAGFWDADDAALHYVDSEQAVMAISVDTSREFEFGEPREIAKLPDEAVEGTFAMRRDGERMLFERRPLEQRFRLPSEQIVMLNRNGEEIERFGEPGLYNRPTFSPDGSRILAVRRDPGRPRNANAAVLIFDVAGGEAQQITAIDDDFDGTNPIWMADGEHIAYAVNSGMGRGEDGSWIYRMRADGRGEAEPLFRTDLGVVSLTLTDVSAGDEFLLFDSFGVVQSVRLTGNNPLERQGIDVLRGEFEFSSARLSPDMRLLAYTYNEGERPEVYLSPFDAETGTATAGERHQVSDGVRPPGPFASVLALRLPLIWADDGRELYFSARGQVMAVSVSTEPSLQTGEPRPLFESSSRLVDVSSDGQRFLFVMPVASQ